VAPAGADVKTSLTDFNLDRGLAELTGIRNLEGVGVLTFALEGSGNTPNQIMREFAGDASLALTRGALIGVTSSKARRLERRPLSNFADLRGGRTPFERIAAKARFTEGSVMLEEIQIDSSLLRVTLSGAASIARRDLELRGVASLVRPATASTGTGTKVFDLPFLLQGPWESPFFLPDADELIQRSGAAAPLLDAARAKNSPSTVRSVIESLTGQRPAEETPAPEPPAAAPAPAQR
jgi:AsmA protein